VEQHLNELDSVDDDAWARGSASPDSTSVDRDALLDEVLRVVGSLTQADKLGPDENLTELGIESLVLLATLAALEDALGVEIIEAVLGDGSGEGVLSVVTARLLADLAFEELAARVRRDRG
jgi:acyl carrier protein